MLGNKTAEDKIKVARTQLIINHPFYAYLALRMEMVEAEWCGTMATDGRDIFWSRKFVDGLTVKEVTGVIAHEVLHCAWLHHLRVGKRHHTIWNIAADIAINDLLIDGGFQLPKGGVFGPDFAKYKNKHVEEIYNELLKDAKSYSKMKFDSPGGKGGEGQDGDGQGGEGQDGDGGSEGTTWGGVIQPKGEDGKPLSEAEQAHMESEMKIKVKEAATAAKNIGKLPAGLEGLIEAAGRSKVDWTDYIPAWIKGIIPDNYTWAKPNRKMFTNHGVYMPSMQFNGAGTGILSIDTSGSVSDKELVSYVNEIVGLIEKCSPQTLYIIQHDAVIQKIDEWNGEEFKSLTTKGRGGTCVAPVFKKVESMDEQIDWMICFTDMEINDFPKEEPDFPVLWCSTGNAKRAPFGTLIRLKEIL